MYYRQTQPEYAAWRAMRQRCRNPDHKYYARYGGRGIAVCARWSSFASFLVDMGPRPSGTSLERRDNDVGYTPMNCVWATASAQCRNRSTSRLLTYRGVTRCLQEWAEALGMNKRTLRERLERGWPLRRAIETPLQKQFSRKNRNEDTNVPSAPPARSRTRIRPDRGGHS